MIRCPVCDGLRSVDVRWQHSKAPCRECRSGRVVLREHFFGFWLEHFTHQEIEDMARAIWGQ